MFRLVLIHNGKAIFTGETPRRLILHSPPQKILGQMNTVDLAWTIDDKIMRVVTDARRSVENWEVARNKRGMKRVISERRKQTQTHYQIVIEYQFVKPNMFRNTFQGRRYNNISRVKIRPGKKNNISYTEETEDINKSELNRKKSAGECPRCVCPGD